MSTSNHSKIWLCKTIAVLVFIVTLFVLININYDFYGIYKNNNSDKVVYKNERTSKYLFSYRYIPENFNGILSGSSITSNWHTDKIENYRIYNSSISGGNISEQKLIIDNILQKQGMEILILCIHPYLTSSYGRKSGFMKSSEYWGSLGSIGLLKEYFSILTNSKIIADRFGRQDFYLEYKDKNNNIKVRNIDIDINYKAVDDFISILNLARSKNLKIVGFIPPIYSESYNLNKSSYDEYFNFIASLFLNNEPILNFNSKAYKDITDNPNTFYDGTHINEDVALIISEELNKFIKTNTEIKKELK